MKICPSCSHLYQSGIVVCPRDGKLLDTLREWRAGDSISEKFRVVEKIGHGSLGPAFRAKVLPFGGVRVLKCLSVRLAEDEQLIGNFQREIKAASELKHTNAVQVESLEHSPDGRPYIAMEHVPGLSLRELLSRGSYIPALDVVEIMGQVCAALDCAHWQGILHRNLKPDNVIIAEEHDGAPRVKVMEFGIANLRQAAAERGKEVGDVVMTDRGAVVGTMEYMSPEQAAGTSSDKLDGRSDYYSVGVMMFEALTGELPLSTEDLAGLLGQYQGAAANEQLCGMVLKALQRDPARRFQTATEMIAAMREVSQSLGKPSPVAVTSAAEAGANRVSSSSQAAPNIFAAGPTQPLRTTFRQKAEPATPLIATRDQKIPAMRAPSAAAASSDAPFEEIRRALLRKAEQFPVRRQARSKLAQTSLLLASFTLGVLLASWVIYRHRELLMSRQNISTTGVGALASPGGADRDAPSSAGPQQILPPQVNPSPDDPLSTVEGPNSLPPLPGVLNEANARPGQRSDGGSSLGKEEPTVTSVRTGDRPPGASTQSEGSMSSDAREAEIKKRIAVGWLQVERGNPQAALESFTEALKLDPSNVETQAAMRLARFAVQNPNVDVLPSPSPADGTDGAKGRP